jgi:hypothetical protein
VTPVTRRLWLFVPPLVVVGLVAYVVLRAVEVKDRGPREESIRVRIASPVDHPSVLQDLPAYVEKFGEDVEAKWFAAEAYTRVRAPAKGYDVLWDDPRIAGDPATTQRYARMLVRVLSGTDEAPTGLRERLLLARAEAGDADARETLRESVASMRFEQGGLVFFKSLVRAPTSALHVVADGWFGREDPMLRLAGAALGTGRQDAGRVETLVGLLTGDWPHPKRGIWSEAIRALGVSDDPRAVEALERLRAAVVGDDVMQQAERVTLDVGLALAGAPGAAERLHEALRDERMRFAFSTYAEGLIWRLYRQDPGAVEKAVAFWDAYPAGRLLLAYGCLVGDPPLPGGVPASAWADALEATGQPGETAVASVYRWRARRPGDDGPRRALLEGLRRALDDPEATAPYASGDDVGSFTVYETLRALLRWPEPRP